MDPLPFIQELMAHTGSAWSYPLIFGVLLACGLGLPMPEDVSLIAGGWLVYEGKAHLLLMMLTGYLGIIAGDSVIFFLGRFVSSRVGKSQSTGFFARLISPEKRARVHSLFKRHGEKIVMIARFLPGVRAPTYFTAGSVGMRYSHFIFFDSIAALASAPIFVYLGYHFGGELEFLLHQIKKGQPGVIAALAVLVVGAVVISRWRSRREAKVEAEALKEESADQSPVRPPDLPSQSKVG